MAEMYGDVMELNERLHKEIASKDKSLESMQSRLKRAGLDVQVQVRVILITSLLHHWYIDTCIVWYVLMLK